MYIHVRRQFRGPFYGPFPKPVLHICPTKRNTVKNGFINVVYIFFFRSHLLPSSPFLLSFRILIVVSQIWGVTKFSLLSHRHNVTVREKTIFGFLSLLPSSIRVELWVGCSRHHQIDDTAYCCCCVSNTLRYRGMLQSNNERLIGNCEGVTYTLS